MMVSTRMAWLSLRNSAARRTKGLGMAGLSPGIEIVGDVISAEGRSKANFFGVQYSIALVRRVSLGCD